MTNFEYGFITKCAEYGVDPNLLIKSAGFGQLVGGAVKGLANGTTKVMGSKLGKYVVSPAIGVGITYGLSKMFGGGEQDPDAFLKNLNKTNPRGGSFGNNTPRLYAPTQYNPHYGVNQQY
jgi:hypothetical protein